jgi:hypothetical protein
LPITPVLVRTAGQTQFVHTYGLLDSGSTSTFCSADLLKQMNVSGKVLPIALTTIEKADTVVNSEEVGLLVADVHEQVETDIPVVYARPVLPMSADNSVALGNVTDK